MATGRGGRVTIAVVLACFVWLTALRPVGRGHVPDQKSVSVTDETALAAHCLIVYQADRFPSARGYHYLFYGNGFFVNEKGYVLTAAHVLGQLHGGQPYLLVRTSAGTLAFVQATVVAMDSDHDIALLLASPNPFEGHYAVSSLPLSPEGPQLGRKVLVAAVRPGNPRDSYTLEPTVEERPEGDVLSFQFSQLEKGRSDTELAIFNDSIQLGESGAPVISPDAHGVVGLVEGEWVRDANRLSAQTKQAMTLTTAGNQTVSIPGAVIPIHYAIALLAQKRIPWQSTSYSASDEPTGDDAITDSPPAPLSLVPAPYPSQALFGGELLLDALISPSGSVASIRVVHGSEPFLRKGIAAVRTWTFLPARVGGQDVESHVAIAFIFLEPYIPARSPAVHNYDEAASAAARDRAALPLTVVEPECPAGINTTDSVIISGTVTLDGQLASIKTLRDRPGLTQATLTALHDWRFLAGKRAGANAESVAVIVSTFRQPLATNHGTQ